MWMVFEDNVSDMINTHNVNPSTFTISAKNGNVLIGCYNANYGEANVINFISDSGVSYYSAHSGDYKGNISQRNDGLAQTINSNYGTLVNSVVNDVAMTVLPNAPIDDATGLPIPTIAVATNGGVSVIKDDGTVVSDSSIYGRPIVTQIEFKGNDRIVGNLHQTGNTTDGVIFIQPNTLPFPEGTDTRYPYFSSSDAALQLAPVTPIGTKQIKVFSENVAVAGDDGLAIIYENQDSPTNGLVAYATTSYNTGWMHGDIKGAFLSDTDATNVTGTELITNGTFGSDVSGWSSNYSTITHQSGQAKVTALSTGILIAQQLSGLVVGKKYVVTATVTPYIGTNYSGWSFYLSNNYTSIIKSFNINDQTTTIVSATFTATATDNYISFGASTGAISSSEYILIDNISLRLAELDRSVNNNGLKVFGTITKSAVATGAELVAYSGWSNSNYLVQPYNSLMQTGTGAFSATAWFKTTSTEENYEGLLYYNRSGSVGGGWQIMLEPNSADKGLYFYVYGASANVATGAVDGLNDGVWHQVVVTHNNGSIQMFIDGTLRRSNSNPSIGSINDSQAKLHIGRWYGDANNSNYHWRGSIALARHSASIPSPEQVKKMYEDEKVLFQENAACTLYGSSDAVTALAYDDSTSILYAGTSSGRSDFQGLRRINNTTTAVTTAMSASNGLVAEQ
jgi:hypothetical protein